jgi:Ca2+-binding EF-hand superfamily protein
MNEQRLSVVKHAFKFLDNEGKGCLEYDRLLEAYNAKDHPRVRTREKKTETIRQEFSDAMGSRAQNDFVDESSFIEYYADLNATMPADKDEYFVELVLRTWQCGTA